MASKQLKEFSREEVAKVRDSPRADANLGLSRATAQQARGYRQFCLPPFPITPSKPLNVVDSG